MRRGVNDATVAFPDEAPVARIWATTFTSPTAEAVYVQPWRALTSRSARVLLKLLTVGPACAPTL